MGAMRKIMDRLKLTVNEEKTHLCQIPRERFDFLGYTFGRCIDRRLARYDSCRSAFPLRGGGKVGDYRSFLFPSNRKSAELRGTKYQATALQRLFRAQANRLRPVIHICCRDPQSVFGGSVWVSSRSLRRSLLKPRAGQSTSR